MTDVVEGMIRELDNDPGLPRASIQAALDRWEETLPRLIEMIEGYARDPEDHVEYVDPIFVAVHLCAHRRETRAYRPLMRLFSMPDGDLALVMGDAVTETLPRVTASVFDGDPGPLREAVAAAQADPFVRGGLLEAMAFLAREGRLDQAETAAYLRDCYDRLEPQGEDPVWFGWQSAVSYLALDGLVDLVRSAFEDGRIDPTILTFEEFLEDMERRRNGGRDERLDISFGYFGDVMEEMADWTIASDLSPEDFGEDFVDELAEGMRAAAPAWQPPVVNPTRHVGRNDPCPCGSGKKYKKCCLT